jgi:putative Mg2+ transporter-C (MgtC) family protein
VRGLTTAASVWVTAAVGFAAGAGLPWLAVESTAAYLIVSLAFTPLARRLPSSGATVFMLRVRYPDGHGVLRQVLNVTTEHGFAVDELTTYGDRDKPGTGGTDAVPLVEVVLQVQVHGKGSPTELATRLSELPQVRAVTSDALNATGE